VKSPTPRHEAPPGQLDLQIMTSNQRPEKPEGANVGSATWRVGVMILEGRIEPTPSATDRQFVHENQTRKPAQETCKNEGTSPEVDENKGALDDKMSSMLRSL